MATFFIFHGIYGNPEENWFPWLKKELVSRGHTVIVPQFPHPEKPVLSAWMSTLEEYQQQLGKNPILIGHSLGATFTLSVLEKYPAAAAFFVTGFVRTPENKFAPLMNTFTEKEFNWAQIKNNGKNFFVFHSDNDPYLTLDIGQEVADKLGVPLTFIKNAGHFNIASGYEKFDLLLEKILNFLK